MYEDLRNINARPKPFEFYTAEILWTDEHISKRMLELHLDESVDLASRKREFIEKSVAWMETRFEIGSGMKIADFGCGPGLYASRLAEKGAQVTGIDFSKSSIDYARKKAAERDLSIDYILSNYLEFSTEGKFDLIIMIFCDYCALSPRQRARLLGIFKDCLEDDGSVFLDVCSQAAFDAREETAVYEHRLHDGFWAAADYYGFLNTFKYEAEKVTLDKYTIIEKSRIWEVYNWLQYFTPDDIAREFEESGLRIEEYYSDIARALSSDDSQQIAVVAKKK